MTSNPAAATVTAVASPALALVKTADADYLQRGGHVIDYSYQLTNTGNVTARRAVHGDRRQGRRDLPRRHDAGHGSILTCTASYTITQADLDAGLVTNTATGHGFYNASPVDSNIGGTTVTSTGAKTHAIVANGDDNSVSIVSLNTMTVLATIPLTGTFPWEVSVSPDRTKAYVSCRGMGADPGGISVIDLVARTESVYITGLTGIRPSQSVVVGNVLYVVYYERFAATNITYLSAVDLSVTPPVETAVLTLPNLGGALSIAATPDGGMLYVGTESAGIYSIDISQVPAVIANIGAPISGLNTFIHDLSVDAAGILSVAAEGDDLIERYDTITGGWADGVAHAFPDTMLFLHGVEADGNRIFAAETWDAGGFSVMTDTGGVWSAAFFPAVFPFDDDANPATPDVPVTGLLHGLALADGYAVAPVVMDFENAVMQNRLAILNRQTLAVTFITVGLGPRAVETY